MRSTATLVALCAALLCGCYPLGRTVFPKDAETKCFLDVDSLCVKLTNVETEGNCNFDIIHRSSGTDTVLSSHARVNERARVPFSFNGGAYELEVADTIEHVFSRDEAVFVLYGPR